MNNAIFIALDDNHWHYFARLYNSIQENYPTHPKLLVYYAGNDTVRMSWLMYKPDIKLEIVRDLPFDIDYDWHHKSVPSKMIYYKYLLWSGQYDEYDNILHLDADTIVLSPLNDIIESPEFFIVRNNLPFKEIRIITENKQYRDVVKRKLKSHNIRYPEQRDMVNAGVFVIPKRYREKEYLDSLINITEDFKYLLDYADQSAISLWCLKHHIHHSEDYRYNFQMPLFTKFFRPRYKGGLNVGNYFSLKKDILDRIKIVHYSGTIKPDCYKFSSWALMGRYGNLFSKCFYKYGGVPW